MSKQVIWLMTDTTRYDEATVRRNFDFYEPMTVHESSLSPCVHAILAARLGYREKAVEIILEEETIRMHRWLQE